MQAGGLVGTKEGPFAVLLHSFHEQVRNPERVEKIAGPQFLLAMVLFEFQKIKNIGVPRLQINGKRTFALAAPLVYIPCRIVENPKHGHNPVGGTVRSLDVGTGRP